VTDPVRAEVSGDARGFAQTVRIRGHELRSDEPIGEREGTDTGPMPFELLLAALGSCTSMTLGVYSRRKGIPLRNVKVELVHHPAPGGVGAKDRIERTITLEGDLDAETRTRLLQIADKCPVHKALTAGIDVSSKLAD